MRKENKRLEKETYIAPDIEVVEIEIEQNILSDTSNVKDFQYNNDTW